MKGKMIPRICSLALLALATGCAGSSFSTAPEMEGGADAQERSDATATADGQGADASRPSESGSGEATTSDGGSVEAGADSQSDSDVSTDTMNEDAPGTDATDSGKDDAAADAAEAGMSDGGVEAGDGSPDVQDAQPDVAADACTPILYFLDGDGDGYGGTSTSMGCVPPTTGTWVTVGGDCDDSNTTVNPAQTAYFAAGYVPPGTTTVSFDYNCDGGETESGNPPKASCQVVNLTCVGSGYLEATPVRSGPGVDPFCGSTEAVNCALTDLVCQEGTPYTLAPITCH